MCQEERLIYRKYRSLWFEAYFDTEFAGNKGDMKPGTECGTYVSSSLVTWCSQKQIVSCSSVEVERHAMTKTAYEML